MHHQREARQALLDLFQHFEVQALRTGELEGSVAGADGAGQRVAAGPFDEFLGLVRIGQFGIGFIHLDMLLHAAQLAEFSFDNDTFGMRRIHHTLGGCNILIERLDRWHRS